MFVVPSIWESSAPYEVDVSLSDLIQDLGVALVKFKVVDERRIAYMHVFAAWGFAQMRKFKSSNACSY